MKKIMLILVLCSTLRSMEHGNTEFSWKNFSNMLVYGTQAVFLDTFFPDLYTRDMVERTIALGIPDLIKVMKPEVSEKNFNYLRWGSIAYALKNEVFIGTEIAKNIYLKGFTRENTLLCKLFLQHGLKTAITFLVPQGIFYLRDNF